MSTQSTAGLHVKRVLSPLHAAFAGDGWTSYVQPTMGGLPILVWSVTQQFLIMVKTNTLRNVVHGVTIG